MYKIEEYLPAPEETPEIIKKAADSIALSWGDNIETLSVSLVYAWNKCYNPSGYQLARILDDDCNFDITTDFIAHLDDMEYTVDKLVREEREKWISDNGIIPELEIGTELTGKYKGQIVGVSDHYLGYYLLHQDGIIGKLLVKFEDAIKYRKES